MDKKLVHTPEGVRDIYGREYTGKLNAQKLIHEKFSLYGYEDIQKKSELLLQESYISFLIKRGILWFYVLILPLQWQDVPQTILWTKMCPSGSVIREIPLLIPAICKEN